MFTVEILEQIGREPISVEASQVVVRLGGTPISVAALFGVEDAVLVSHCVDKNFEECLDKLGINETVLVIKKG